MRGIPSGVLKENYLVQVTGLLLQDFQLIYCEWWCIYSLCVLVNPTKVCMSTLSSQTTPHDC